MVVRWRDAIRGAAFVLAVLANAAFADLFPPLNTLPLQFLRRETFAASCNTGAPTTVDSVPLNTCIAGYIPPDANSAIYSIGSSGELIEAKFASATNCSSQISNSTAAPATGACVANMKYTYPIADAGAKWGVLTTYSGGDCNSLRFGPYAYELETCLPTGDGTTSFKYTLFGFLEFRKFTYSTTTDCTGPATPSAGRSQNVCLPPPPASSWSMIVSASGSGGNTGGSGTGMANTRSSSATNAASSSSSSSSGGGNSTMWPTDTGTHHDGDEWVAYVAIPILVLGCLLILAVGTVFVVRRHRRITGKSACGGVCPECCYTRPTLTHVPFDTGSRETTPPGPVPLSPAAAASVGGMAAALGTGALPPTLPTHTAVPIAEPLELTAVNPTTGASTVRARTASPLAAGSKTILVAPASPRTAAVTTTTDAQ